MEKTRCTIARAHYLIGRIGRSLRAAFLRLKFFAHPADMAIKHGHVRDHQAPPCSARGGEPAGESSARRGVVLAQPGSIPGEFARGLATFPAAGQIQLAEVTLHFMTGFPTPGANGGQMPRCRIGGSASLPPSGNSFCKSANNRRDYPWAVRPASSPTGRRPANPPRK